MLLWTLECTYLWKLVFSIFLDIYSGVELLDHILVSILLLWENTFSCIHSHKEYKRIPFSPHYQICRLYADRFLERWYLIVFLISISIIIKGYWASCHMPVRHLYVLLGKMSAQVFSPFYGLGSLFLFWGFFVCLFVCLFWCWVGWPTYVF